MTPRRAWGILSIATVLVDGAVAVLLVVWGVDPLPVSLFGGVVLLLYAYVVYKRFHVEVVPEKDVVLFQEKEDLRILCGIYGLETKGNFRDLRKRLMEFARVHNGESFTWVAPKAILSFGAGASSPQPEPPSEPSVLDQLLKDADEEVVRTRGLVFGQQRTGTKAVSVKRCPVCDARAPRSKTLCPECGADLEFYITLSGSKVGKRMVREKAKAMRKLRQDVPPLAGP